MVLAESTLRDEFNTRIKCRNKGGKFSEVIVPQNECIFFQMLSVKAAVTYNKCKN